jgi:hypothetical protein
MSEKAPPGTGHVLAEADLAARAVDVPTKLGRPGTVAHERRVHELAAEERRREEEAADGSPEKPAQLGADV